MKDLKIYLLYKFEKLLDECFQLFRSVSFKSEIIRKKLTDASFAEMFFLLK